MSYVEPPARIGRGEVEEGAEVNPPAIEITSFSAIDDGSDVNYTVDWSPSSNVSDADHSVEAAFFGLNGTVVATGSESSPQTNTQITATDTGAGDGTSDKWHRVELELLNSSGNTISTVSSKTIEAT